MTRPLNYLAQPPLAPFTVERVNSASDLQWRVADATGATVYRTCTEKGSRDEADRRNANAGY